MKLWKFLFTFFFVFSVFSRLNPNKKTNKKGVSKYVIDSFEYSYVFGSLSIDSKWGVLTLIPKNIMIELV